MTQEQKDTIREALIACGMECSCDADHVCDKHVKINRANIALNSLPVDKPVEAKPQKPSKDVKQIVDDIVYSLFENIGNQKVESITDLITAYADEIRRENQSLFVSLSYDGDSGKFHWKTHRGVALVGDEAGSVNKLGYRIITLNKKRFRAGRLAWFLEYGEWPKGVVDHINGNKDDNRIENLRDVSVAENNRNLEKHRNGHIVGTSYSKKQKAWKAAIVRDGKSIHLGFYPTQEEAGEVYRAAIMGKEAGE